MKHGQKLIGELGELQPEAGLFPHAQSADAPATARPRSSGARPASTAKTPTASPIYDWTILDRIFDTYLERGVRPYVQIGFMPKDLSIKPEPYQHRWTPRARYEEIYTGWAYPPKDYDKWGELVYQWAKHCVERYGREEVETWYWQVWNEAEHRLLARHAGGVSQAARLRDRRRAPRTADGEGRRARHGRQRRPIHARASSSTACAARTTRRARPARRSISSRFTPRARPTYVDGHVRMGIANQLRTIDDGFRIVASFPELKDKPIVIGESDPEGCAACQGPQLAYRNGTMYSSYTAASFARKHDLAEKHGVNLEGAFTWAFEFEDQPYFAGFRSLATNGIDKPVLNVFRMFSKMSGQRLDVESDHAVPLDAMLARGVREQPDVSALASLDQNRLCVLVWHYHDDDVAGPAADVELAVAGLPAAAERSAPGALSHRRRSQQRVYRLEADGFASVAHGRAILLSCSTRESWQH